MTGAAGHRSSPEARLQSGDGGAQVKMIVVRTQARTGGTAPATLPPLHPDPSAVGGLGLDRGRGLRPDGEMHPPAAAGRAFDQQFVEILAALVAEVEQDHRIAQRLFQARGRMRPAEEIPPSGTIAF